MDVYWIDKDGLTRQRIEDVPSLLKREDGFVWVDVPEGVEGSGDVLRKVFALHPRGLEDCEERSLVPKVRLFTDHLLLVLNTPERARSGRIGHFELGIFLAKRFLVSVHEPATGTVARDARTLIEGQTKAIVAKENRPASPAELMHSVVAALILGIDLFIGELAREVAALEQRVLSGGRDRPEQLLEEMFIVRQKLIAIRAMADQDSGVMARAVGLAAGFLPAADQNALEDLKERYDRTGALCDAQQMLLQGVIDLYQTRVTTRMNVAMERLALLTAGALPVTLVASIYGMNLIVNQHTQPIALAVTLAVMAVISSAMLWWAKRQGWW